jgi:hypothetical protein
MRRGWTLRPRRLSSGPANPRILPGMELLQDHDLAPTGTTREGRPEFRLLRTLRHGGVIVPVNYVTDLYSLALTASRTIGWLVLMLWQPKSGAASTAAVLHDWLYETMFFGEDADGRRAADDVLRDMMHRAAIPAHRVYAAYYAVRLFGARGYGKVTFANRQLVADFWQAQQGGGAS